MSEKADAVYARAFRPLQEGDPTTKAGRELVIRLAGRGLVDYDELNDLVVEAEKEAVRAVQRDEGEAMTEEVAVLNDLPPACKDAACGWVSVPHVHEGEAVYPLPPDRPEWTPFLLSGFNDEEAKA
jgi:hypothetical protein